MVRSMNSRSCMYNGISQSGHYDRVRGTWLRTSTCAIKYSILRPFLYFLWVEVALQNRH